MQTDLTATNKLNKLNNIILKSMWFIISVYSALKFSKIILIEVRVIQILFLKLRKCLDSSLLAQFQLILTENKFQLCKGNFHK